MSRDLMAQIEEIVYPRSLALIGASNREGALGRLFLDCFLYTGFEPFYLVNPRQENILGRKAYRSIKDIPGEVDLAVVVTSADTLPQVVSECTQKGVKGVAIFTAGFGETDPGLKKVEQQLVDIAHNGGTRLIGPNCIGIYCPESKLSYPLMPGTEPGTVGAVSQSGSVVDMLTWQATEMGVKFSKTISCGNECDLTAVDFFEYLGQDAKTEMIIAYLEGVKEGARFYRLARRIAAIKPVIVWKGGLTDTGARAASSHTGALSGSRRTWETLFRQTGIIQVHSYEDAFDALLAFYHLPLPSGRRVVVVSGGGGSAVGTTDAVVELGLEPAQLLPETSSKIAQVIPPVGTSSGNPVDLSIAVLRQPDIFGPVLRALVEDENVDMVLLVGAPSPEFTDLVVPIVNGTRKPVAVSVSLAFEGSHQEYKRLSQGGVAVFTDPRRAALALSRIADYADFRARALRDD